MGREKKSGAKRDFKLTNMPPMECGNRSARSKRQASMVALARRVLQTQRHVAKAAGRDAVEDLGEHFLW
jgi:hypothetical protein